MMMELAVSYGIEDGAWDALDAEIIGIVEGVKGQMIGSGAGFGGRDLQFCFDDGALAGKAVELLFQKFGDELLSMSLIPFRAELACGFRA